MSFLLGKTKLCFYPGWTEFTDVSDDNVCMSVLAWLREREREREERERERAKEQSQKGLSESMSCAQIYEERFYNVVVSVDILAAVTNKSLYVHWWALHSILCETVAGQRRQRSICGPGRVCIHTAMWSEWSDLRTHISIQRCSLVIRSFSTDVWHQVWHVSQVLWQKDETANIV